MAIVWGYTEEGIPISVRAPTKVARELARWAETEKRRALLKKLTEYKPPISPAALVPGLKKAQIGAVPYKEGTYKGHRYIVAGAWEFSEASVNEHLMRYVDWIAMARKDARVLSVRDEVKTSSETDTCMNLHTWIGRNIRYKLQSDDPLPFEVFWARKEGDCTEFANFSSSALGIPSWLKLISYNYTDFLHVYLYLRGGNVWFPFDGTNYYPFGEPEGIKAVWLFQVDDTPDNPPVGKVYGPEAPVPPEAEQLSPQVYISRIAFLGKVALGVGIAGLAYLLIDTLLRK